MYIVNISSVLVVAGGSFEGVYIVQTLRRGLGCIAGGPDNFVYIVNEAPRRWGLQVECSPPRPTVILLDLLVEPFWSPRYF